MKADREVWAWVCVEAGTACPLRVLRGCGNLGELGRGLPAAGRPFDPARRDLRMNRAAARFTSSGPTLVCGRIAICWDLFYWGGRGVEQGAGVGYEFSEAVGEGEDAFGLAEADGLFGD